MRSLLFIGKNSKIFAEIKKDLSSQFTLSAISHKEIVKTHTRFDIVIIGSFSKKIESNLILFDNIKKSFFFNKIIYLSSAVVELDNTYNYYNYVKIKKNLEHYFFSFFRENSVVLRPYQVVRLEGSKYPLTSKPNDFLKKIQLVSKNRNSSKVISFEPFLCDSISSPNFIYRTLFANKLFLCSNCCFCFVNSSIAFLICVILLFVPCNFSNVCIVFVKSVVIVSSSVVLALTMLFCLSMFD